VADTAYARNGHVHIAYEIHGSGPHDLVFMPGTFVPIESYDEHPMLGRFFKRLRTFARVLILDRRGMGQSDPLGPEGAPSNDESIADLTAVVADAGFSKPSILAGFDAGLIAMGLAASRPDAVASLVVVNTFAKFLRSDDHPSGFDPERAAQYDQVVEAGAQVGGEFDLLALAAPSVSTAWASAWCRFRLQAGWPTTRSSRTASAVCSRAESLSARCSAGSASCSAGTSPSACSARISSCASDRRTTTRW
jgi:pimeloyl-ACP methyl ester carboxylesterase